MSTIEALPFYIALAGPTASGETAAALAIAARHPVEIISVDSALVYRGMDIGTAKPSAAERRAGAAPPDRHPRPATRLQRRRVCARRQARSSSAVAARGKLPLLVGGTMLYFKALAQGPGRHARRRPRRARRHRRRGASPGLARAARPAGRSGPATAARLAPADSQRIQRAMEVYRISGQPLSVLQQAAGRTAQGGQHSVLISLEPQDRAWLHQRIAQRFDAMLADGLLDEVQRLRSNPALHAELPAMRCVGYRQAWEALDGHWPPAELRERGIAATRQLAKRQLTWLRSMPQRHTVACDAEDALERVLGVVDSVVTRELEARTRD